MKGVPPVVSLLIAESFDGIHTGAGVRRKLKRMMAELSRQAEWSLDNYRYFDSDVAAVTDFVVRPSGALDPFTTLESCGGVACLFRTAEQFARSVGLLSDRVVLPDVFTPYFLGGHVLDGDSWHGLLRKIVVLERLKPLIEAGIVVFNDLPVRSVSPNERQQLSDAAIHVLDQIESELKFTRKSGIVEISTGSLFHRPLHKSFRIPSGREHETTRELGRAAFIPELVRDLEDILQDLREAGRTRAILAAGSRLGVLAVRALENRMPELRTLDAWEATRSLELPWVDSLTPHEVVQLRGEAADALPRLRALVGKHIGRTSDDNDQRVVELVRELRAESAEVESELKTLKWTKQRGFRTLTGALGLTIAVYGVSSGFVPASVALGSLLSLLGILHSSERQDERDHEQLASRPGYLLLKARNLLEHRHE